MQRFEIVVVGAGPAGIAAAVSAAESGAQVCVLDAGAAPGGQIWRGGAERHSRTAARWATRLRQGQQISVQQNTQVVAPLAAGELLVERPDGPQSIGYDRLILATGARELLLPFPGWTLPGVTGVGGLQALIKGGVPIKGRRVVVAGSGPLLLAVAAGLRRSGAEVRLIAEQSDWARLLAFGAQLPLDPARLLQALRLRATLGRTAYRAGCWVEQAHGAEQLEAVTLRHGAQRWREPCEQLACGFGLVPNSELAATLGCAINAGAVVVDYAQQTSVSGILAAGEVAGIAGVEAALAEGAIAGYIAAGRPAQAQPLLARRAAARRFARRLEHTFALRAELRQLASAQTIVCRCEDVHYAALAEHPSWRSAKIHTRCGMGPCQGRICGAATSVLFGWTPESIRPPVAPVALATLITTSSAHSINLEEHV